MRDFFLAREAAQFAFAANALRPLPGSMIGVPAFFSGWLTAELAPHLAALTAVDATQHSVRHGVHNRRDAAALALAGANLAAYAALIAGGRRAALGIEDALVGELGEHYQDAILRDPLPDDVNAPWPSLALPFRMRNVDVTRRRRLRYAPGGRRFELDVFHHRDNPSGVPVLLQVHGGAWVIGTKDQQAIPLMLHMAARKWVCVSVNYPLSPRARWPEHLIAVKRALAWIRENIAEYGGDPSFVAVTGGSAGGHIASMMALTGDDKSLQPGFEDVDMTVQACVPHYGVYDLTHESGARYARQRVRSLLKPYVMPRGAQYPQDYEQASPLYRVNPQAPPFLVVHGAHDTLVPVVEARQFVQRLREESKNPVVYAEVAGAQHAFDIFPSFRSAGVVRGVARFLEWCHATRDERGAPVEREPATG